MQFARADNAHAYAIPNSIIRSRAIYVAFPNAAIIIVIIYGFRSQ